MARDFDGVDDRVVGTITPVDSGDWTAGCWFYADVITGQTRDLIFIETAGGSSVQVLRVNSSSVMRVLQVSSGTSADTVSTTTVATGQWYCAFGTFRASDGKCRIFVGTQLVAVAELSYSAQPALTATRTTAGVTLGIGNSPTALSTDFDGRISRAFFTARELTLAEMNDFRRGTQPTRDDTSLRVYWPLDDTSIITSVRDFSGRGATGTPTTVVAAIGPAITGSVETEGAWDFDGSLSKIQGTIAVVSTGDWTMGAWVYADTSGEGTNGAIITNSLSDSAQVAFMLQGGKLRNVQGFSTTNADSRHDTAFPTGAWKCVVSTYRDSDKKVRLFIGDLSTAVAEISTYELQSAGVGTRSTGATAFVVGNGTLQSLTWDGRISRAFFTARELTVTEMNAFRTGTQPDSSDADLRVYYSFRDNIIGDNSTNKVAGLITGAAAFADPIFPGTRPQYA